MRIYLNYFIKLSGEYVEALLVNYISWLGPDFLGSIDCAIPEQDDAEAETYGIKEPEDGTVEPFLEFEEQRASEHTPTKPNSKATRGARNSGKPAK